MNQIQRSNLTIVEIIAVIVAGSPFQFTVGPITDGGAHKVRAVGPGLERGEVNKPCQLIILIIIATLFEQRRVQFLKYI